MRRPTTPRRSAPPAAALLAVALVLLLPPSTLRGQYRRDAPILMPGDLRDGELALGLGASYRRHAGFPLSGLRGDLYDLGELDVAYGIDDRALIRVTGEALRVLAIEERAGSHVPLDGDVLDGSSADFGDFRIATVLRVLGEDRGLASGVGFSVQLPNSNERKGIGLNTTNFFGRAYAAYRRDDLRAVASAGIAILEAPLEDFVQNDVLAIAADVAYGPAGAPWRLYAGLQGRVNTRERIPVGTEDRGGVEAGVNLLLGEWTVDLGAAHRLTGPVGRWGLDAGLSRTLGR